MHFYDGMQVSARGDIAVVENRSDLEAINKELSKLDDKLFCAWNVTPTGRQAWVVYEWIGDSVPPHRVLTWTDESGNPKPLTWAIVDAVKSTEGGADRLWESIMADEEKRQQGISANLVANVAGIIAEDGRKAEGKVGALLPRSVSLRQARDRQRRQGLRK